MSLIIYAIRWIGSNMAMPFWIVGHIHITMNVYEDIYEILASLGMNIIVALAFWMDWNDQKKKIKSLDILKIRVIIKKKNNGSTTFNTRRKS